MIHRFLPMLGAAALLASAAHAQTVLYGNLNATIGTYYAVEGQGPLYNSFSTGSTSVLLTDVKVYLQLEDDPVNGVTVALYADSNSSPGAQIKALGSLSDSTIVSPGVFDVPVNPGVTLSPNKRYWIGMSVSGQSEIAWASTNSTGGTGNIANEYNCYWGYFSRPTQTPTKPLAHGEPISFQCFSNSVSQDPFLMQVTATAVTPLNVPDLSFTGMTLLTLLLAACAAVFLNRSATNES